MALYQEHVLKIFSSPTVGHKTKYWTQSTVKLAEGNKKQNFSFYLNSAVFRAGGKPVTPVRESQVEDLVTVFSQRLNLHTGDTVKQPPELPVPRHSRCTKTDPELFQAATCLITPYTHTQPLSEFFKAAIEYLVSCTWVPGYRAWYAVIAVEQLPPEELISGDSLPLSAGQTSTQHGIMGQTQEDLQHQAIWQKWDTLHPDILCTTKTSQQLLKQRQPTDGLCPIMQF